MKKYLAAATGALILAAASLSYAQTPSGAEKPKGETTKAAKGGMKGTTGKAAKKPKAAKRTKGGMGGGMGGMKGKQDNWGDEWLRGWTLEKK